MSEDDRFPIDDAPLARYLAGAAPGIRPPLKSRQIAGGQSNPTYHVNASGADFVLRRKPPGELAPKAHMIEREFELLTALDTTPVPVPKPVHFCADASVIGSAFYLMEHVPGRVERDPALPGLTPEVRRRTHEAMIDTLALLHGVDWHAVGLAEFGREGGYLGRQVTIWSRQYAASPSAGQQEMDRLVAWLPDAVAEVPDETCLVHGDYRIDNLILSPDAPRVAAVIDWELATLGHPLADLAYYLMTWTFPAGLRHGLAEADLVDLGIPDLAALTERYCAATGRAGVAHLDTLLAYATFRMAAILAGVHARALAGNAADADAADLGAQVAPLARIALGHAERAGL